MVTAKAKGPSETIIGNGVSFTTWVKSFAVRLSVVACPLPGVAGRRLQPAQRSARAAAAVFMVCLVGIGKRLRA